MNSFPGLSITSLNENFIVNYYWLSNIIKLTTLNNNRIDLIKTKLQDIASNYGKNGFIKQMDRNDILLTSFEALKIIEVIEYLKTLNKSHLPINKIKCMCEGPIYHLDEKLSNGNSKGRDYQFEFLLGSKLNKLGFEISGFDDIQIKYFSNLIRIECKRPTKNKTAKYGFEQAVNQLYTKIANSPDEYGMIALSIERIDNFDQTLFLGNDVNKVEEKLLNFKNKLLKSMSNNIKIGSNKKIIGLILSIHTLLWDEVSGNFISIEPTFIKKIQTEKTIKIHEYLYNGFMEKLILNDELRLEME